MKHPSTWTRAELHAHLQHALDLEMWTVPLYLTSLYSIKDLLTLEQRNYPDAAKLVYSVVVQEMLHIELVCNISNALGHRPRFKPPVYDERKGIPFIHPLKEQLPADLHGYSIQPQALNEQSLRLFCAIELPHPRRDITWENEHRYNSIAELYAALKLGITALWDECFVGAEHNHKQKNTFQEYHNRNGRHHGFSIMIGSLVEAQKAIDAIVEQGEGADSHRVPADFRPPAGEDGKEHSTAWYKGHLSHYQKFRVLLHAHHKLPPVYATTRNEAGNVPQAELNKVFGTLLSEMECAFNEKGEELPGTFWTKMHAMGPAIAAVWQSGNCPVFAE